jgi:hypothetical protein
MKKQLTIIIVSPCLMFWRFFKTEQNKSLQEQYAVNKVSAVIRK